MAWASAGAAAVLLAGVLGCMSVGLTGKKVWYENRSIPGLRIGLRFWPWDQQWKLEHLHAFDRAGDTSAMERFAAVRMRAWPTDPESHLIAAAWLETKGDYHGAIERFRRAVVTVPNGRCYLPGYQAYLKMVDRPDYPADAPGLGPEAAPCVAIFRRSDAEPGRGPHLGPPHLGHLGPLARDARSRRSSSNWLGIGLGRGKGIRNRGSHLPFDVGLRP